MSTSCDDYAILHKNCPLFINRPICRRDTESPADSMESALHPVLLMS